MAKLVADLGNELSPIWAAQEAQREQDRTFLGDAATVPQKTTRTVLIPTKSDELVQLMKTDLCNKPTGEYNMPDEYNTQASNLFTVGLAPSFGTEEKLESDLQNINGVREKSNNELAATSPELQQVNEKAGKIETAIETVRKLGRDHSLIKANQVRLAKG